jgi:hypothetical protein
MIVDAVALFHVERSAQAERAVDLPPSFRVSEREIPAL